MAVWQNVSELRDGQDVAAETFNKPIGELASRTDYLKAMLDRLMADDGRGSVVVQVKLVSDDTPSVGDIVCVDPKSGLYRKAVASMSLYDAYTASERAFAIGILTYREDNALSGLVTLYGKIRLGSDFDTSVLVAGRETFTGGQYYLSSTVPGKITRYPAGPRILVGYFAVAVQQLGSYNGTVAFINPQHMDIEAHAHRTYTLLARPAGVSRVVYETVTPEPEPEPTPPGPTPSTPGIEVVGDDLNRYKLGIDEDQQVYVEDIESQRTAADEDSNDSNDSTDYSDSNDVIGHVIVEGYLPDEVANDGEGVPRLVVCGDWLADFSEIYTVTVSNGVEDCDAGTASWPVDVSWCRVNSDECGSGRLNYFGDSVAVGTHGLRVRLEPSEGMSEATPFGVIWLTDAQRTWTIDRFSGRGWAKADVNEVVPIGYGLLRFSGVSDRFMNHVSVCVPVRMYNLTGAITEISDGDTLSVGDRVYTFKDDPESDTDIQILDVTVQHDTYDTLAQLCGFEDAVFDETLRQVILATDGSDVVFTHGGSPTTLSPLNLGEGTFALASYDGGESIAVPLTVASLGADLSVVPLAYWTPAELSNGLTVMVVPPLDGIQPGDEAHADFYCVPGAKYRYAIEFDNDLKLHFPPVPARSGCLMLNGVELESYENYGDRAVIAIGDDSIYWRDDTETRQPWPVPEMSQGDKVDPEDEYRELFHFVSEFHSETGPVTSLHPAEGSPVTVKRCGTDEDAVVGDLEIDVDLMLGMHDAGAPGYKVPKAARGNKMLLGPVVEKIIAGPGISLSKTAGVPDGQGIVKISADGAEYAGDFETIAMENAKLESVGMFPYVRLLGWGEGQQNIPTGFVAKFHVPATAFNSVYRVKFYASVFGETSFEGGIRHAGVKMDYSILPDFTGLNGGVVADANLRTGLIQPDQSVILDIPFGSSDESVESGVSYTAYDPILVHNDSSIEDFAGRSAQVLGYAFPTEDDCADYILAHAGQLSGPFGVRPGYTVAVRFSRTAPAEGEAYTGSIGFLNLRWAIEEVATVKVTKSQEDDIVEQTVRNLRAAAKKAGVMDSGYSVVNILTRIVNALK